ncbi:hypothetical protein [Paraburkholderia fungorum]|uniref:Uncharacterized protein n=1 Tax=Paraburkholderia fungorum TaxID=134537 RepID=A0AAW3UU89_9BURK|nr:hypothetical protein [Paraburkholderia fungorum]MBB4513894.1 hypothetical protein [Paraburkholderia fungorum]MBB6201135.1 hypothetical protein [Paraburkholderia fungorum]
MLFPEPREHFLYGHSRAVGVELKPLLGTIDVASRMGILSKHPRIYVRPGDATRTAMVVPFPFIGDLLLYLEDEAGVYALNWSVTDKLKDFRLRGRPPARKSESDDRDLSERDSKSIENIYYQDAGIRTQKVAGEFVDFELRCNLYELFLAQDRMVGLPREMIIEITAMFQTAVGSNVVGYEVVRHVAARFGIKDDAALIILKQAVWNRELRVDLFRPFLVDKPLHPEVCDVFERYRDWFRR